jgi:hypothetical protein
MGPPTPGTVAVTVLVAVSTTASEEPAGRYANGVALAALAAITIASASTIAQADIADPPGRSDDAPQRLRSADVATSSIHPMTFLL